MDVSKLLPMANDLELFAGLKNWLPHRIIDCHFHLHLNNDGLDIFNHSAKNPGQTFNWFDLNTHRLVLEKFDFVPSFYQAVAFGLPFSPDESQNNFNLYRLRPRPMEIYPIPCLTSSLVNQVDWQPFRNVNGIKTKIRTQGGNDEISKHFSKETWEWLNFGNRFLIIHLPQNVWQNASELAFLANKYRWINFIIAHLGGAFLFNEQLPSALETLRPFSNVFFDTAMVTDPESVLAAVKIIGCKRIIFGSDAPFGYLRGEFIRHEEQTLFLPGFAWPWLDSRFSKLALKPGNMVFLQSLSAIRAALQASGADSDYNRNAIFFQNAIKLIT